MSIFFGMLQIDRKFPSHDAIEQWTLGLVVATPQGEFTSTDRLLWMADLASQIGKEKVHLIIGIALADLPPPGETLGLEEMNVLAIVPGQSWKKEDVEHEYQKLAQRVRPPAYLLCDGATELRQPAEKPFIDGQRSIVLGDLWHHSADVLEKEIGRTERFKRFMSEVGHTRNRTQNSVPSLRHRSN